MTVKPTVWSPAGPVSLLACALTQRRVPTMLVSAAGVRSRLVAAGVRQRFVAVSLGSPVSKPKLLLVSAKARIVSVPPVEPV